MSRKGWGLCVAALALTGCGAGYSKGAYDTGYTSFDSDPAQGSGGGSGTATDPGGEQEEDLRLVPPAQTARYVFVPNVDRGTVTRIEARTQRADTVAVGSGPARAVAAGETIVVHCATDHTVALLDAESLEVRTVPVRQGLNRLQISPDLRWAVLWADQDGEAGSGVVSYNELSLVDLSSGAHFGLAVGEYPQAVQFTEDGRTAVVLSERWLAVLELGGASVNAQLLPLGEDLSTIAPAEEFLLDPAGRYAVVRQLGVESLLRVDLPTGGLEALAVGLTPTDMDLSPDGRSLVVVARGSTEIWVLDAEDPSQVQRVVDLPDLTAFGSLTFADHGQVAVLSTNASLVPQVALWYPATDTFEQLPLPKPVQTVLVSPGGTAVTVLHTRDDAADADRDSPFYDQDALSLIDLDGSLLVNSLVLDSAVLAHALSPTGAYGYVVLAKGGQLVQLDYQRLLHVGVDLPSRPVLVGALPAEGPGEPPVWVSQEYPLGRVSFYTPDPPSLQTITGFELNSGIERDQ